MFVDIDGQDWFVNNSTGMVIYVKDAKEITKELLNKIGYSGNPKDFQNIGSNTMFGKKVSYGSVNNILKDEIAVIDNPEIFMNRFDYKKAEKVTIQETEQISGGMMGFEENIEQPFPEIKQLDLAKITYVKSEILNTKTDFKINRADYSSSSFKKATYRLIKPFGQDIHKTAEFPGNISNCSNFQMGFQELLKSISHAFTDYITTKKI